MSRILARDCAFKMIFQYLFNEDVKSENLYAEYDLTDEEKEFSLNILNLMKNNFDALNEKISKNLKNNLTIKDIYKLDYAIILFALTCTDYLNESVSLSINESVELAKKYSTDKSPSFINGFLSSIYKNNN